MLLHYLGRVLLPPQWGNVVTVLTYTDVCFAVNRIMRKVSKDFHETVYDYWLHGELVKFWGGSSSKWPKDSHFWFLWLYISVYVFIAICQIVPAYCVSSICGIRGGMWSSLENITYKKPQKLAQLSLYKCTNVAFIQLLLNFLLLFDLKNNLNNRQ